MTLLATLRKLAQIWQHALIPAQTSEGMARQKYHRLS